ncbi:MAG: HupE/UreJ family protein [Chitinophagaceae bacterium]
MFYDYFQLGWKHIIDWNALDHILFVMVLTASYTIKDWRQVLLLATSFTIGHSVTLALSVSNILTVPLRVIEILIPVTIIVAAIFNLFQTKSVTNKGGRLYVLALFFGLVHGLGFASGLKSLLGPGNKIVLPLLGFNVGLEAGQVVVIAAVLIAGMLAFKVLKANRRDWIVFISGAACSVAFTMVAARW